MRSVLIYCQILFYLFPITLWALSYYAFDWDNNIINMPTPMLVKNSKTGTIDPVPANLYGPIANKTAGYEHYAFFEDSFHYNHDDPTGKENYFLNDIKKALESGSENWKGPDWNSFVRTLNDPEMAAHTVIITAREQSSAVILAGLEYLKEKGFIKNTLRPENIWSVNHPQFGQMVKERIHKEVPSQILSAEGKEGDAKRKFFVMKYYLDKIVSAHKEIKKGETQSVTQDVWYYSDDNEANTKIVEEKMSSEMKKNEYRNLKIELHFTGSPSSKTAPYFKVMTHTTGK